MQYQGMQRSSGFSREYIERWLPQTSKTQRQCRLSSVAKADSLISWRQAHVTGPYRPYDSKLILWSSALLHLLLDCCYCSVCTTCPISKISPLKRAHCAIQSGSHDHSWPKQLSARGYAFMRSPTAGAVHDDIAQAIQPAHQGL